MTLYIVPIVEGETEVGCVERLFHRIWIELLKCPERLQVLPPSRGQRDALIDSSRPDLADKIGEAFAKLTKRVRRDPDGRGLLLLLLDAEGDCPAELAVRLLKSAHEARADADIVCVLAKRMLENWIVAGASTLAGLNDLPDPLPARNQFEGHIGNIWYEEHRGAAWLEKQLRSMNRNRCYKKTLDAKVFVQSIDLAECRDNSPSFAKLCRDLEKRLPAKAGPAGEQTQP